MTSSFQYKFNEPLQLDKYQHNMFTSFKTNPTEDGYRISGVLKYSLAALSSVQRLYIKYWGARPGESRSGHVGSSMPYASEDIAFDRSPNVGIANVIDGKFVFTIKSPHSYYKDDGGELVKPTVYLQVCDTLNQSCTVIYSISLSNEKGSTGTPSTGTGRLKVVEPLQSQWKKFVQRGAR